MKIKTAKLILFIMILFFSIPAAFAKTTDEVSYFAVFIQKLDASSSEYKDYYALRTRADVKKVDIDTDLEVGKYRYRIKSAEPDACDYSEWFYFEIIDETGRAYPGPYVNFSAGYILPVILFDDVIPDYMGKRYWPLSGTVNFDFIPVKTRAGNFGFAVKGFYTRMSKDYSNYNITGNLISAYLDLVYQKALNSVFTLDFHAGAGGLMFHNFTISYENVVSDKSLNSLDMSFDAGLALNIFFTRNLFLRTDADFSYSIMTDMVLGQLIPEISLGVHF
jgi:hypothetical protein